MTNTPVMVVGTSAKRRRHFIAEAFGSEYELRFVSPDIDEKAHRSSDAGALTALIASAKMEAVLASMEDERNHELKAVVEASPRSVAVTFDQVVVWQGQIREKPTDASEARAFIQSYSKSALATVQTTCVYAFASKARALCRNDTVTYYDELPDELIDRVVARRDCLYSAGAFVVEDPDMHRCMIKVDPGTEIEVQGMCERAIREGIHKVVCLDA